MGLWRLSPSLQTNSSTILPVCVHTLHLSTLVFVFCLPSTQHQVQITVAPRGNPPTHKQHKQTENGVSYGYLLS